LSKKWQMNSASSSFDESQNSSPLLNTFSDILPIDKNGATSDCFKVRIYGKWHFLKRPKEEFKNHPLYIAAFEKEFDLGFTLDHPNIVRYLNKGNDTQGIYILTEYVDGLTLNDFRVKYPHYFQKEVNIRRILSQLVAALAYLHSHQIVHLDIKPENILITNNGNNVKLIDLGLSYSDCYTEITGGTHTFGSPEQFGHSERIDERSDMYAVGKMMLYLYTGQVDILKVQKLPIGLRNLAKRCLQEDIHQRTITAYEFLSVLSRKRANYNLAVVVVLFIILFIGIIEWRKPKIAPVEPASIKNMLLGKPKNDFKEKTVIHKEPFGTPTQIYPINKVENRHSNSNENTKALQSIYANHFRKEYGDSAKLFSKEDSIKGIIKLFLRERLMPSNSVIRKAYSDINQYNVNQLRKAFEEWKDNCNADCKAVYVGFKDVISYRDFESIYTEELNKINKPVQEKLDKFNQ
jgi:serine/threonine protein kinase